MTSTNAPQTRFVRVSSADSPRARAPQATTGDVAIYCRKSKKGDKDQITVTRQKKLALLDCDKLGLEVKPERIYVDNGVSAWQRNRKREGWDSLIEAARRGEISHIVCYHPDRLMRQPHDLEELLSISDQHGIVLYGRVNKRDLQDPDDRYALRIEVAHACRSSDDTSRRLKDEMAERAEKGEPHTGKRRYGYDKAGMKIIEHEAAIVREIFDRFTKGEGPTTIAKDLNQRGVKTAFGNTWMPSSVRLQLRSRYVTGIRVHHGEEVGNGIWPAIIDRGTWELAQEMLDYRARATKDEKDDQRFYLLRGLVVCGKCGTRMGGAGGRYKCYRQFRKDEKHCARSISAATLEEFAEGVAIKYLEKLSVDGRPVGEAAKEAKDAIADDERQLRELNEMWTAKVITTREYREMRREITERIAKNERKTVVRPIKLLEGLTGPDAAKKWAKLKDDPERKNATLRLLFSEIIIKEQTKAVGAFDYGRIDIFENELV
ncbi:MAG TPA: recombinase family protein [Streptosporangiaceae bacterium]|nr:recombinase family protein [Streptosporangiaceae bacterium]